MLLPQASPKRTAKKRKATEAPPGSALDAPLLGEQVYISAHVLVSNCLLRLLLTLQNSSRTTQKLSLQQQRSVNKQNTHWCFEETCASHMKEHGTQNCTYVPLPYSLNHDVLQDWANAYQQNRASATAELLTLMTQVQ